MKCFIVNSKPYDEEKVYNALKKFKLHTTSLPTKAFFILAVGGDGAVIKASSIAREFNLPIIGYNTGTLGFLSSDGELEDILSAFMKDELVKDKRYPLQLTYDGIVSYSLNELAIVGRETGHLVEVDMSVNNRHVLTYKGDGLIVSTPTGSTAWNLSVGGPILTPTTKGIVVSPISPFSLSARPIVLDEHTVIKLDKVEKMVIDGNNIVYNKNSEVVIKLSNNPITLLRKDYNFYNSIKEKLGWGNNIK